MRSFTLALALVVLAPMQHASANLITGIFGGQLNNVNGNYNPTTQAFEGFGLGLNLGDPFHGSFAYDSRSGTPTYFKADVGGLDLVASNLRLDAQLFDGFLTFFAVAGELNNGLFMSVGLTNGSPVFTEIPPQSLSADDWVLRAFKISATSADAIETHCCDIDSVGAHYAGDPVPPSRFFLRTVAVPEPGTLSLLGIGLVGIGFMRRRMAN